MASTLLAIPIRLGTGALRHPAYHTSGLHIARHVKPLVVNIAVPKHLSTAPSRQMRMGTISKRPKFVSKGPPLLSTRRWVLYSISIFATFMEGCYHFVIPVDYKGPALENPFYQMVGSES